MTTHFVDPFLLLHGPVEMSPAFVHPRIGANMLSQNRLFLRSNAPAPPPPFATLPRRSLLCSELSSAMRRPCDTDSERDRHGYQATPGMTPPAGVSAPASQHATPRHATPRDNVHHEET